MLDLDDRLGDLDERGLRQRLRMVSGPQGPSVVLEGRPVLSLCSGNALGLADHPRVRQAAADAAMRWGVGACAARVASGTMTLHRRLEEALSTFTARPAALLFGSGSAANLAVIPALARRGEVVLCDERSHASLREGCRLSGAEVVPYRHADAEHLAWALRAAAGRASLVVTDGLFGTEGDVAPLAEIVEHAQRADARVLVSEGHALGALGPGGRGAVAEAGLEAEVDVVTGTLGKALGAYGGFVACDHVTARYLVHSAGALQHSVATAPPAAAAALAALELLAEEPRRVARLAANADTLRSALAREGFEIAGLHAHVVPLVVGGSATAAALVERALDLGVFVEALRPPSVPEGTARIRAIALATHTRAELTDAARALGRAALAAGFRPGAGMPVAAAVATDTGVPERRDDAPHRRDDAPAPTAAPEREADELEVPAFAQAA